MPPRNGPFNRRSPALSPMTVRIKQANPPRQVASVSRALHILELLVSHPSHELGVSDVARRLEIGKSTAHQLLATLVAHGFVDQCEGSPRYRLGVRAIEAGAVAASHIGLGPALTPFLETLVAEVKETCSIGAITGNSITLLQRVEAESVLRVDLKVGTRLPLHTSAIGRVLMSTMPPETLAQQLDELDLSAAERLETEEALRVARTEECSIVRNIPVDGISAIAVAIRSSNQRPVGGLVVAGPSFRFEPSACRHALLKTAGSIAARLAGRQPG